MIISSINSRNLVLDFWEIYGKCNYIYIMRIFHEHIWNYRDSCRIICCDTFNSADYSDIKNQRCEMIISFDVLDMGDMMSMLDNLWLVFRFLADGIFQFNHYDLFSDNVGIDMEIF